MTGDDLRKAKLSLDEDLSRAIYHRLIAFQKSADGIIPEYVDVRLQFIEFRGTPKQLTRCNVSTTLPLW